MFTFLSFDLHWILPYLLFGAILVSLAWVRVLEKGMLPKNPTVEQNCVLLFATIVGILIWPLDLIFAGLFAIFLLLGRAFTETR